MGRLILSPLVNIINHDTKNILDSNAGLFYLISSIMNFLNSNSIYNNHSNNNNVLTNENPTLDYPNNFLKNNTSNVSNIANLPHLQSSNNPYAASSSAPSNDPNNSSTHNENYKIRSGNNHSDSDPNLSSGIDVNGRGTNNGEVNGPSNNTISSTSGTMENSNTKFNHHFPFHNPFDINSYPITNPPIFDSTMMIDFTSSDGIPRRRRISISNGQIGQIINHEAILENDSPLDDLQQQIQSSQLPGELGCSMTVDTFPRQQTPPIQIQQQQHQQFLSVSQSQQRPPVPPQQSQLQNSLSETLSDAAGVPPPNHQLIYNDEVIYNPNNGPIPGTAAWKKERLLERNRIAASKCRQRKKQAQKQLEESVNKYEKQIAEYNTKFKKYENLFSFYNSTLNNYFQNNSTDSLQVLKKFANFDNIDDIKDEDLVFHSK